MGKATYHGYENLPDEIPQPISVLLGKNLRKNSEEASKKHHASKKQKENPKETESPQKK